MDVGRYTKNAEDQRSTFNAAKATCDQAAQRLLAA